MKNIKVKKISEIAVIKSGSTPLRSENDRYFKGGTIPWVKTMDLNNNFIYQTNELITETAIKESSCSIFPVGTILVAMYGGFNQIGRTGLLKIEAAINQAISAIQLDEKVAVPEYILHYLNARVNYWKRFAASSRKDPNITRNDVCKFPVLLPSVDEQKRIINVLTEWDSAIAITEKLITAKRRLKQGLRQKVFFSDKSKSWKMYKLGDLFERITRKNDIGCEIVLTSSGEQGLINQKDFFNRRVASADLSGYYLMRKGEFAYNRSSMKGYPYGAIKRLDRYETAALSTLYVCFRLIQKDFSSNFFLYLFEAGVLNGEIYKIVNEGARSHGLLNLSIPTFFDIKIRVPEINVQNKIAMIFETVDCEINLLAQYLENLKNQKQGLMQQLLTGKIRIQTP
jgi:type I restriction enzyme, S subunit